jgi:hypothetical protein
MASPILSIDAIPQVPDAPSGQTGWGNLRPEQSWRGRKKKPRAGRADAGQKQRAWAGGQIKRAEQLKHGCPDLVPLQSNFFQKTFAAQ